MSPNCSWTNVPDPKEIWAHGGRYKEPAVVNRQSACVYIQSVSCTWLFSDPVDCSLPDYSVHDIFQARILELPFPSPGDLPDPRMEPTSPELEGRVFTTAQLEKPNRQRGFPIIVDNDSSHIASLHHRFGLYSLCAVYEAIISAPNSYLYTLLWSVTLEITALFSILCSSYIHSIVFSKILFALNAQLFLSYSSSPWCYVTALFFFCLGEGNGTPLQYSCLENPIDGGAW